MTKLSGWLCHCLLQLIDKLQQAGKIDNLPQVCGVFGCVKSNLLLADLLQLVETTCNKLVDNTFCISTCNRFVVNKLSHTMQTHADISLLITSLLQDVNRLVAKCAFLFCFVVHCKHVLAFLIYQPLYFAVCLPTFKHSLFLSIRFFSSCSSRSDLAMRSVSQRVVYIFSVSSCLFLSSSFSKICSFLSWQTWS